MNKILLQLLLVFCASNLPFLSARGQGILFHEDFNDIDVKIYRTSADNGYRNWTIEGAQGAYDPTSNASNPRVLNFNSNGVYATTMAITSLDGDAILTFRYYATTENLATLNVTINNSGVFEDNNTNTKSITTPLYQKYYTATYRIKNCTAATTITFARPSDGKTFCIDDVYILSATMPMAEATNNATTLEAYQGLTTDVTLTRTLKAGIWNTLCLPFDVSTTAFSKGNPQFRLFTSVTENTLNFMEAESVETGTPFLVKVDEDIVNPTFKNVTIEKTTPLTVTNGGISFVGLFSPYDMATDGNEHFLGLDGCLYQPASETNTIKGMRAIFRATSSARLRTNLVENETSRIANVSNEKHNNSWYYIDGRKTDAKRARKGLFIRNGKKLIIQ